MVKADEEGMTLHRSECARTRGRCGRLRDDSQAPRRWPPVARRSVPSDLRNQPPPGARSGFHVERDYERVCVPQDASAGIRPVLSLISAPLGLCPERLPALAASPLDRRSHGTGGRISQPCPRVPKEGAFGRRRCRTSTMETVGRPMGSLHRDGRSSERCGRGRRSYPIARGQTPGWM